MLGELRSVGGLDVATAGLVSELNAPLLTTIEGNVGNAVVHKSYDLTDPAIRRQISGFGRPAPGDFA